MANLTPVAGSKVKAPLIAECPVNLECRTQTVLELGSHDMFVAEIVATHIDEEMLEDDGRINIEKLNPLVYCTQARQYWTGLSAMLGKYGFMSAELKAQPLRSGPDEKKR
jgi:flavin reductase (DIM6/NTAB) family NADH-FMN oxidoreductase RutF